MFARPKLRVAMVLSAALGSTACTLMADSFHPEKALATAEPAETDAGAPRPPAVSAPDAAGPRCRDGLTSGCGVELSQPAGACDSDEDCASGVCIAGACAPPACSDGRHNGEEQGVDCGGACSASCDASCSSGEDCPSGRCSDGECLTATCEDSIRNQGETGVDCGGPCTARCGAGEGCGDDEDCGPELFCAAQSRTCAAISCQDGVQNGAELDTDCGGGTCPGCPPDAPCAVPGDCASGVCGSAGVCSAPACDDGVQNGDEPVSDCGNSLCGPCALGSPCTASGECASGLCQGGTCVPPPCADGLRNGSESDVDCGGTDPACARCAVGDACATEADCASGECTEGQCSACGDNVSNGSETGVDCGGACGACPPGQGCSSDADCQSGACQDARCCGGTAADCTRCALRLAAPILSCDTRGPEAAPDCEAFLQCLRDNPDACPTRTQPGCSDDPGGVCNHTLFGGNGSAGLSLADSIIGTAQCSF